MAGQKSGEAPGKTPYEPGGAEVWSDSNRDRDYFSDKLFGREASLEQSKQRDKDVDRLSKEKSQGARNLEDVPTRSYGARNLDVPSSGVYTKEAPPRFNKGGIVGPNRTKWGSPKVTAPCADTKTIKCY